MGVGKIYLMKAARLEEEAKVESIVKSVVEGGEKARNTLIMP